MAAGYAHMIALTTARDVFTWGSNRYGQLGLGTTSTAGGSGGCGGGGGMFSTPQRVRIMSGLEIKHFGAGENHTCVLTSTGDIYTWGRGDYGQLGHGDLHGRDTPTLLKAFDNRSQPRKLAAGADFMFVLTYSGAVYSWGRNSFGQLGHGAAAQARAPGAPPPPPDEAAPRLVRFFSGDKDEVEEEDIVLSTISCGAHHVVAVSAGRGAVYAWGRGEHGQLGLDLRDARARSVPLPQLVPRLRGMTVLHAACGLNHTLVVAETADRRRVVLAFGRGSYGQLGHGSGKPVPPPYFRAAAAAAAASACHNVGDGDRESPGPISGPGASAANGAMAWAGRSGRPEHGVGGPVDRTLALMRSAPLAAVRMRLSRRAASAASAAPAPRPESGASAASPQRSASAGAQQRAASPVNGFSRTQSAAAAGRDPAAEAAAAEAEAAAAAAAAAEAEPQEEFAERVLRELMSRPSYRCGPCGRVALLNRQSGVRCTAGAGTAACRWRHRPRCAWVQGTSPGRAGELRGGLGSLQEGCDQGRGTGRVDYDPPGRPLRVGRRR